MVIPRVPVVLFANGFSHSAEARELQCAPLQSGEHGEGACDDSQVLLRIWLVDVSGLLKPSKIKLFYHVLSIDAMVLPSFRKKYLG